MAVVQLKTFYNYFPDQDPKTIPNEIGHFNIFDIAGILAPKSKQVTYSRRSFYKVSLIEGHSKIHYADQCIEIKGHTLVFTNPMVPYFWERISEKHTGYLCVFTEDFFSRFGSINQYPVFQGADTAIIPLSDDKAEIFNTLFARMFEELQSNYTYKYDLLRNLLMEVIHGAQKMQPAIGTQTFTHNAAERITSLFVELLERQFPIELNNQAIKINSASAFAAQLNIHVNHLNKALKEITGKTTTQLINERILQEAKILLKSTNWNIAEIGWCLGFKESNHFSNFFKSRVKTAALKYRQSQID
ncbi:helix-turn-helix domain-containing protein [Flavobacterium subsaxonicum]|uniref:Transcriptional regulator n=1 Tax=Flavobacterium subsaxonicum WB 4.1-42 = DSM 21790 TaxID=1121898 RepID=A0A0A2MRJ5_9FLAO|nr:helix-turn-helix transcriptional regulator [Flavobacterium subsaxonicum]KGO94161.1 transcriptional regulator [Flavobacterium subsaxonicum WB 4.1-42 = DSM 21790]